MRNKDIYNRLSISAKNTLDEYLEDLKDEILIEAEKETKKEDFASTEIRLKEIIFAIRQLNTQEEKINQLTLKRKRMYLMVSMVGLLYTLVGIGYYLFSSVKIDIKENIGLVVAILGVMISIMAYFFGQFSNQRFKNKELTIQDDNLKFEDKNYELFKRWQIIENQTRTVLDSTKKKSDRPVSFSELLDFLITEFAKDKQEELQIRDLLSARNKIAHDGNIESHSELNRLINISDKLINELDKKLK